MPGIVRMPVRQQLADPFKLADGSFGQHPLSAMGICSELDNVRRIRTDIPSAIRALVQFKKIPPHRGRPGAAEVCYLAIYLSGTS